MRSSVTLGIDFCHRFHGYPGEELYLHGHHGRLTLEVEGPVNAKTGFVRPCNEVERIAWNYLQNFDHTTILQNEDPFLPRILKVYSEEGIRNEDSIAATKWATFANELVRVYSDWRLVVVRKAPTCENLLEVFYSLLKKELNIKKMKFTSGKSAAVARIG